VYTLTAQVLTSLCLLTCGVVAYLVARRIPAREEVFRYGWQLSAATFCIQGTNSLLHDLFATVAFIGGSHSRAWAAILVWHPVLNHSRTFLLTTFCLVLCVALVRADRGRPVPPMRTSVALLLAGMLVGGLVGMHEDKFSGLTHFTAVAVWDLMELLAMMAVLLVGLSSGGMDRGLWAALGINAFTLALSVLWFAYLSRIDVGGQWAPRPYHIHFSKAALYMLMIAVEVRQLRRLGRGRPTRGFFDPPQSGVAMSSFA
jgi:hypothetical protein